MTSLYIVLICTASQKTSYYIIWSITSAMLTDFQKFFTDRFISKYATKFSLIIPPRVKRVAALPCETSISDKNSSGIEIANVNFFTTTSYNTSKYNPLLNIQHDARGGAAIGCGLVVLARRVSHAPICCNEIRF